MDPAPETRLYFVDYQPRQAEELWRLFHASIHGLCTEHYSRSQLAAWSPPDYDHESWSMRMGQLKPLVAMLDETAVAYADLQQDGAIEHFFGHPVYRGLGIAGALMEQLLERGRCLSLARVYAAVSLTAQPFFSKQGFRIFYRQSVPLAGEYLDNAIMVRAL